MSKKILSLALDSAILDQNDSLYVTWLIRLDTDRQHLLSLFPYSDTAVMTNCCSSPNMGKRDVSPVHWITDFFFLFFTLEFSCGSVASARLWAHFLFFFNLIYIYKTNSTTSYYISLLIVLFWQEMQLNCNTVHIVQLVMILHKYIF